MGLSDLFADVISSLGFAEAQAEAPPAEETQDNTSAEAEEKPADEQPAEEPAEEEEQSEPEEEEEEEVEDVKPKLEEGEFAFSQIPTLSFSFSLRSIEPNG